MIQQWPETRRDNLIYAQVEAVDKPQLPILRGPHNGRELPRLDRREGRLALVDPVRRGLDDFQSILEQVDDVDAR
jgi:hypothetical protein